MRARMALNCANELTICPPCARIASRTAVLTVAETSTRKNPCASAKAPLGTVSVSTPGAIRHALHDEPAIMKLGVDLLLSGRPGFFFRGQRHGFAAAHSVRASVHMLLWRTAAANNEIWVERERARPERGKSSNGHESSEGWGRHSEKWYFRLSVNKNTVPWDLTMRRRLNQFSNRTKQKD